MSKNIDAISVPYQEPDTYMGTCTYCGHANSRTDWDKTMKTAPLAPMYCGYCKVITQHSNVKKVR